jgi:GTPase-associated protein 1, N-terminal domain type 2
MVASPSRVPGQNGGLGRMVADQILLTHCSREDAVLGQGGFGVRAASTSDPELLKWALRDLCRYELPFDMQRGRVMISQTPRQLALVPAPGNRMALVHSSYLPGDSCVPPRPHAFVTHVLVYPRLDTRSAAGAWNSPDWLKHEIERGASKSLEPMEGVPRGSLVHDQAVTDFLSGSDAPADQSVSSAIFSSRFESDHEARRYCVRATLHAFLRTFEAGAARTRVCVMAEPGTVALLAYIVARLLPPIYAETFWFSTYESPHSSLREDKVARLVGSFAPRPIDRGETEFLRRGGYLVDMIRFPPNSGPDLTGDAISWPLEDLLSLSTAGNWPAVDAIRALWVADPPAPTPAALSEAVRARPLIDDLRRGAVTIERLAAFHRTAFGQRMLRDPDLRDHAWNVLRPVSNRPDVRHNFADLIEEHAAELDTDLRSRAATTPPDEPSGMGIGPREKLSRPRSPVGKRDVVKPAERQPTHVTRERMLFLGVGILLPLAAQLVLWFVTGGGLSSGGRRSADAPENQTPGVKEETSKYVILLERYMDLEAKYKTVTEKLTEAETTIKALRARTGSQATASKPKDEHKGREDSSSERNDAPGRPGTGRSPP